MLVELQRGVKPTDTLIDITALRELRQCAMDGSRLNIGGLATHNDVIASEACVRYALPLAAVLGGRRAADPHSRDDRRQPDHRLAGQ